MASDHERLRGGGDVQRLTVKAKTLRLCARMRRSNLRQRVWHKRAMPAQDSDRQRGTTGLIVTHRSAESDDGVGGDEGVGLRVQTAWRLRLSDLLTPSIMTMIDPPASHFET
eukprot:2916108-Rhodomonas_salina.1